jgi:hypothetical protein
LLHPASRDVIDRILTQDSKGTAARALRDVSEFNSSLDFVVVFALEAMRVLIKYYRPADEAEQNAWHRTEVSPIKIERIDQRFVEETKGNN